MITCLTGMQFIQMGDGTTRQLAVLPVGKFKTDKYGSMDFESVCDEIIAAFAAGIPKNGVFIDVDHDFGKSRGWVQALGYGTYTGKDGEEKPALVATVDYTEEGSQMLADGEYKGTSAAFGPHTDPETGKRWPNVLRAVSLTNLPVLTFLPEPLDSSVRMMSGEHAELITLGDVVDKVNEEHTDEIPRELWAAAWGLWPATDAFSCLVREALAEGLTGDDLKTRFEELAADLPDALFEAIKQSIAAEKDSPSIDAPSAPVTPLDPTLSDHGAAPVAHTVPASTAKGGNMETEVKLAEATARLAQVEAELSERKAAEHKSKVVAVLATLAIDEASRKGLEAVLLSDGDVLLSEGAEPMSRDDALLSVLGNIVIVPQEKPAVELANPDDGEVELTDAEASIARQMGISIEMVKESKKKEA